MTREEAIRILASSCIPGSKQTEALETLIPELRESEDERIRKQLIEAIKIGRSNSGISFTEEAASRYIAWLEKQKEQKELPLMNDDADLYFDTWRQEVPVPTFRQCFEEGMRYAQGLQKEQKPVNHNFTTFHRDVVYCAMCDRNLDEGLRCNLEIVYKIIKDIVDRTPVVEEQKPEWSEEDEHRRTDAIYFLESAKSHYADTSEIEKTIGWLKSLRPSLKPSDVCYGPKGDPDPAGVWKPSEEQMKALQNAVALTACDKELARLYNQLKKLGVEEEPEYYQHFDPDC